MTSLLSATGVHGIYIRCFMLSIMTSAARSKK